MDIQQFCVGRCEMEFSVPRGRVDSRPRSHEETNKFLSIEEAFDKVGLVVFLLFTM